VECVVIVGHVRRWHNELKELSCWMGGPVLALAALDFVTSRSGMTAAEVVRVNALKRTGTTRQAFLQHEQCTAKSGLTQDPDLQ